MTDEKEYGSLGRLAPEWDGDERERNLTADDIYERFFGWVEDVKGIEPWPHQEEAIMDLLAGDHVILNTPTGSGKSLVALGMHFAALCTGRRSYYTAPIKALVSEKFFDLVEVFGRDNVGMITGDSHINADAPIICCTAEILANQALREGTHADVGLVAMDEFHYYGDPERGWAWQVPLLTLPQTQFLLMSATLGNVDAIADKLSDLNDTPDVDVIADAPRPVPLSYEYTLDPMEKPWNSPSATAKPRFTWSTFRRTPHWRPRKRSPPPVYPARNSAKPSQKPSKASSSPQPSARFCSDCCAPVSASITPACCLATAAWSNSSPSRVCCR